MTLREDTAGLHTWIQRPDRCRVAFIAQDVRLVEHPDGTYTLEADDLTEPVALDREAVVTARAQLANYAAAVLHDHRLARRLLDAAIHGDDPDAWTRCCIADTRLDMDGRGWE